MCNMISCKISLRFCSLQSVPQKKCKLSQIHKKYLITYSIFGQQREIEKTRMTLKLLQL